MECTAPLLLPGEQFRQLNSTSGDPRMAPPVGFRVAKAAA